MKYNKKLPINGIDANIPCGLSRDLCAALKYVESKNGEPIKEDDNIFEYLYRYIEATYYPKDWNAKYEEDINSVLIKVLHKMIITVMYRMDF